MIPQLSRTAFTVRIFLSSFAKLRDGVFFAKIAEKTLALKLDCSIKTVQRALKELYDAV